MLAKLTGFKKAANVIGLTDIDLKCGAAEFYREFQEQDRRVLTQQYESNIDICKYANDKVRAFIA